MDIDVHIIPTQRRLPKRNPLSGHGQAGRPYPRPNDWSVLEEGDAIIGFCNGEYLETSPPSAKKTRRTIFVNCMTWLFNKEKGTHEAGAHCHVPLPERRSQAEKHAPAQALQRRPLHCVHDLQALLPQRLLPFIAERSGNTSAAGASPGRTRTGRRQHAPHLRILVSPLFSVACFWASTRGAGRKSENLDGWIRTARDQREVSQQDSTSTVK